MFGCSVHDMQSHLLFLACETRMHAMTTATAVPAAAQQVGAAVPRRRAAPLLPRLNAQLPGESGKQHHRGRLQGRGCKSKVIANLMDARHDPMLEECNTCSVQWNESGNVLCNGDEPMNVVRNASRTGFRSDTRIMLDNQAVDKPLCSS